MLRVGGFCNVRYDSFFFVVDDMIPNGGQLLSHQCDHNAKSVPDIESFGPSAIVQFLYQRSRHQSGFCNWDTNSSFYVVDDKRPNNG